MISNHGLLLFSSFLFLFTASAYVIPTPSTPNPPTTAPATKPSLPPPKAPVSPVVYPPRGPSSPIGIKPPVSPYHPSPPIGVKPPVGPYPPRGPSPPIVIKPPVGPSPPMTVAPPAPAPYYGSLPPVKKEECKPLCGTRCAKHSRMAVCMRACTTCCSRCKCVPPGTYGNKQVCGRCYTDMTTHGGRLKCP